MKKIVVLSDIHAENSGNWRQNLSDKRKYWQGADMVVFNGDTLNWTSNYNKNETGEAVKFINELCLEDGVEPFIIAGNSDYLISENHYFVHEESKTLILHGEVIFPEVSPWRREYKLLLKRFNGFIKDHESISEVERKFEAARYAMDIYEYDKSYMNSFANKLPWIISPASWIRLIRAWKKFPEATAAYAKKYFPDVQRVVIGHFHRAGCWNIDGMEIICTGAFKKFSKPNIVTICGEEVTTEISSE